MEAMKQAAPSVVVRKIIHATPERVFEAWTKPELMQQWLFPHEGKARSSNRLEVGGTYQHDMFFKGHVDDCKPEQGADDEGYLCYPHYGEYLEIVPPKRLVFTWSSLAVKNTRVTVDLRKVENGTEVTITHELITDPTQIKSHTSGWEGCLEKLATFLA